MALYSPGIWYDAQIDEKIAQIDAIKEAYDESIRRLPDLRDELVARGEELSDLVRVRHAKAYVEHEDTPYAVYDLAQSLLRCQQLASVPDVEVVKIKRTRKPRGMTRGSVRWLREQQRRVK